MATPQEFEVTVDAGADAVVVAVSGDLDMSNAGALTDALTQAGGSGAVVVADLSAVTFIDSSAVSALLESARALSDAGGRLAVGPRSAMVARVLDITGLSTGTDDLDVHALPEGPTADG
ncbi:MAG: STAS domain-containing protein [Acidimicrobiales bacterium]